MDENWWVNFVIKSLELYTYIITSSVIGVGILMSVYFWLNLIFVCAESPTHHPLDNMHVTDPEKLLTPTMERGKQQVWVAEEF